MAELTGNKYLAFFSTNGGKNSPRAASPSEIVPIARSDSKSDAKELISSLRAKWPHVCRAIFAPWKIYWFFDEHDYYQKGGQFLYEEVLTTIQKENEDVLVKFCKEWSDNNKAQFHVVKLIPAEQLFHPSDQTKYGIGFLRRAKEWMTDAFDRALDLETTAGPKVNIDASVQNKLQPDVPRKSDEPFHSSRVTSAPPQMQQGFDASRTHQNAPNLQPTFFIPGQHAFTAGNMNPQGPYLQADFTQHGAQFVLVPSTEQSHHPMFPGAPALQSMIPTMQNHNGDIYTDAPPFANQLDLTPGASTPGRQVFVPNTALQQATQFCVPQLVQSQATALLQSPFGERPRRGSNGRGRGRGSGPGGIGPRRGSTGQDNQLGDAPWNRSPETARGNRARKNSARRNTLDKHSSNPSELPTPLETDEPFFNSSALSPTGKDGTNETRTVIDQPPSTPPSASPHKTSGHGMQIASALPPGASYTPGAVVPESMRVTAEFIGSARDDILSVFLRVMKPVTEAEVRKVLEPVVGIRSIHVVPDKTCCVFVNLSSTADVRKAIEWGLGRPHMKPEVPKNKWTEAPPGWLQQEPLSPSSPRHFAAPQKQVGNRTQGASLDEKSRPPPIDTRSIRNRRFSPQDARSSIDLSEPTSESATSEQTTLTNNRSGTSAMETKMSPLPDIVEHPHEANDDNPSISKPNHIDRTSEIGVPSQNGGDELTVKEEPEFALEIRKKSSISENEAGTEQSKAKTSFSDAEHRQEASNVDLTDSDQTGPSKLAAQGLASPNPLSDPGIQKEKLPPVDKLDIRKSTRKSKAKKSKSHRAASSKLGDVLEPDKVTKRDVTRGTGGVDQNSEIPSTDTMQEASQPGAHLCQGQVIVEPDRDLSDATKAHDEADVRMSEEELPDLATPIGAVLPPLEEVVARAAGHILSAQQDTTGTSTPSTTTTTTPSSAKTSRRPSGGITSSTQELRSWNDDYDELIGTLEELLQAGKTHAAEWLSAAKSRKSSLEQAEKAIQDYDKKVETVSKGTLKKSTKKRRTALESHQHEYDNLIMLVNTARSVMQIHKETESKRRRYGYSLKQDELTSSVHTSHKGGEESAEGPKIIDHSPGALDAPISTIWDLFRTGSVMPRHITRLDLLSGNFGIGEDNASERRNARDRRVRRAGPVDGAANEESDEEAGTLSKLLSDHNSRAKRDENSKRPSLWLLQYEEQGDVDKESNKSLDEEHAELLPVSGIKDPDTELLTTGDTTGMADDEHCVALGQEAIPSDAEDARWGLVVMSDNESASTLGSDEVRKAGETEAAQAIGLGIEDAGIPDLKTEAKREKTPPSSATDATMSPNETSAAKPAISITEGSKEASSAGGPESPGAQRRVSARAQDPRIALPKTMSWAKVAAGPKSDTSAATSPTLVLSAAQGIKRPRGSPAPTAGDMGRGIGRNRSVDITSSDRGRSQTRRRGGEQDDWSVPAGDEWAKKGFPVKKRE